MARVNVGVHPSLLFDQWLVAESVEITMITGSLLANDLIIKGYVPSRFKLGTGHINFFKNKIDYLCRRLELVNTCMRERGFLPGTHLNIKDWPVEYTNSQWVASQVDSDILRARLVEKARNKPLGFWRYYGRSIDTQERLDQMLQSITTSELSI